MKKRRTSRPLSSAAPNYYISPFVQRKFQGSIVTILSNIAALIIYAVLLDLTLNDLTGIITFFVLAVLHIAACTIMGFNFNSKMWLFSGLIIFLISSVAFVYLNM